MMLMDEDEVKLINRDELQKKIKLMQDSRRGKRMQDIQKEKNIPERSLYDFADPDVLKSAKSWDEFDKLSSQLFPYNMLSKSVFYLLENKNLITDTEEVKKRLSKDISHTVRYLCEKKNYDGIILLFENIVEKDEDFIYILNFLAEENRDLFMKHFKKKYLNKLSTQAYLLYNYESNILLKFFSFFSYWI